MSRQLIPVEFKLGEVGEQHRKTVLVREVHVVVEIHVLRIFAALGVGDLGAGLGAVDKTVGIPLGQEEATHLHMVHDKGEIHAKLIHLGHPLIHGIGAVTRAAAVGVHMLIGTVGTLALIEGIHCRKVGAALGKDHVAILGAAFPIGAAVFDPLGGVIGRLGRTAPLDLKAIEHSILDPHGISVALDSNGRLVATGIQKAAISHR